MSWRRLLAAGLAVAAAAGLAGGALESWRFGTTMESAASRAESYVRRDFDRMSGALARAASQVATDPAAVPGLQGGPDTAPVLFDLLARTVPAGGSPADQVSVTIYDSNGHARAWAGRPSDIPSDRSTGPSAFFVTPSLLGLRLVHVMPIAGPDQHRLGSVAAEHVLSQAPVSATILPSDYRLPTPLGPASLRTRWLGAGEQPRPGAFLLRAPAGDPLLEVSLSPDDVRRARRVWRLRIAAVVGAIAGAVVLLLIGPLLDRRAERRTPREVCVLTCASMALVLGAAGAWWGSLVLGGRRPATAALLLLGGGTAAAMVGLIAGPALQLRAVWHARRRDAAAAAVVFALTQVAAGAAVALLIAAFERVLQLAADPATIDLRHFSLHPWSLTRITLLLGILSCHVAALWAGALVLATSASRWRLRAGWGPGRAAIALLWLAPTAALAIAAARRDWPLPPWGLVASASAAVVAALAVRRVAAWYRHATVAARILALFLAFLTPGLLLYPSVAFFSEAATRRLIVTRYAVEAQNHSQTLQDRMAEAERQVDALTVLPYLVTGATPPPPGTPPPTDSAFAVWAQTALASARLTSAVELYDAAGALVSRFALNFPEYAGTTQAPEAAAACSWDVFAEAAPFGSEERRMLRAQRRICVTRSPGAPLESVGAIVLHAVWDYRTLPFITSQSPYFEVFRPAGGGAPREGSTGSDIHVVIYGWGLRPIYTSGGAAWPITDELFARIYKSREPFWTTIEQDGARHHVYFTNDRAAIYATGFPVLTVFDHFVHLAELTSLAGATYVLVLLTSALFTRVARQQPRTGRALLREIRASFYRKLFLAFVLASIVPVLTLALVIRAYFATQLLEDIEAQAARTAAVAQRVIEQSAALQQRAADGVSAVSDDVMVWISQVIGQDVNIFEGANLVATSERDLFASGLLPTRTPDDVYRAIALQRLPSFVGEDRIGTFPYLLAAAPVRAGGRDAILTVPLANRQREIEREIDDLDRGVHLAALFFVLLGAGIGLSMAERIADPVRRLTRATRRIAHGDFDAQIAVRTSDELRRLVDAFNSMAAELKAQRTQLERTHRLEAWAEMARQVAHEIKNPLTPIQLSAEHLRRVHHDRGEPMGAVLESCVTSILGQVRLLRQISGEFSSFASSPTARPAPVDVPPLVEEVVDPYRTGLAGRIDIVNRVAPPLPRVLVDRTLVTRALANVIENALHAMPSPGALTIDAAEGGGMVTLELRDSGVGMDEEALARVFEPYFSTKTTGTGLGLPIARRNIELCGGSVEVESEKGKGTLVRMRLPIAPDGRQP